jgi:translation elongation factor EF-Tu-like GTPase
MHPELIKIKANLTLYPTNKGGRTTGIRTGYRPNHVFEYENFKQTYIGMISFDEKEWILPGETANVLVEFIDMLDVRKFINIGRKWWIHEALRKLGEVEIIEIMER